MTKLSIIIPVYNGEQYIEKCLNCFNNNNYSYEIILVNDGSTDNSTEICKSIAKKNKKIKYISKENGGPSTARNEGIKAANGTYITFIDVDDQINFDELIKLAKKMEKENLDYIVNDFFNTLRNHFYINQKNLLKTLAKLIASEGINSCCSKIYKTEIIKKQSIYFDEKLDLGEDAIFNIYYYKYVKKAYIVHNQLYIYNKDNNNSLTQKYRHNKLEILNKYNKKLNNMLNDTYKKNKYLTNAVKWKKIKNYFSCLKSAVLASKLTPKEHENIIKELKKEKKFTIITSFGLKKFLYSLGYSFLPTTTLYKIVNFRYKKKINNKVAIITLSGNINYGNKLQNYALYKTISKLGYVPETIWVNSTYDGNIITTVLRYMKIQLSKIKNNKLERVQKFKLFDKKHIKYSDYKINFYTNLKKIDKEYSKFVVGSDQVWNYKMTHNFNVYLLENFSYKKNISYAASFGISNIPKEIQEKYKKGLNNIKNISVRELRGKELVKEICNKESHLVLDPTLLLTYAEWTDIEQKPQNFDNKKYILTYFLGTYTNERRNEIKKLAAKEKLNIINLNDKENPQYFNYDPCEFLYLFHNAEIVFTDSFHACVFSIIYNKTFCVYDRMPRKENNMNSRLDTLLNEFGLNERKIKNISDIENIFNINYNKMKPKLETLRENSISFLKNSLNDIQEDSCK